MYSTINYTLPNANENPLSKLKKENKSDIKDGDISEIGDIVFKTCVDATLNVD